MTTRSLHQTFPALALAWAALIVMEALGLSLAFDGQALSQSGVWWTAWIARGRLAPAVALAALAAVWVLYPGALRTAGARLLAASRGRSRRALWGVAHGASFGALFLLSRTVFAAVGGEAFAGLGWTLAALATAGTWLLWFAPAQAWIVETVRCRRPLLTGLAVGGAAWVAGLLSARLWEPLAGATFQAASALLRWRYPNVEATLATRSIHVGDFGVQIAPECSGLEGIGLVSVFLAAYLALFRERHRFPAAWLLFPVGFAAIWLANVGRIAALTVVGVELSPVIAVQGFHSQAGWIGFTLVAVGLVSAAGRVPFLLREGEPPASAAESRRGDSAPYLAPLVALLSGAMATTAFAATWDPFYAVRIAAAALALWLFRDHYRQFVTRPSWAAVGIGVTVFVGWLALEPLYQGGDSDDPAPPEFAGALWLSFRAAGSTLVIPIVEELAFRSYLIRRLQSPDFEAIPSRPVAMLPAIGSSIAFGLLHGRWLAGGLAGLAYAYALHRRGELSDAVLAHVTTNGLIAVAVLAAGRWELWL